MNANIIYALLLYFSGASLYYRYRYDEMMNEINKIIEENRNDPDLDFLGEHYDVAMHKGLKILYLILCVFWPYYLFIDVIQDLRYAFKFKG